MACKPPDIPLCACLDIHSLNHNHRISQCAGKPPSDCSATFCEETMCIVEADGCLQMILLRNIKIKIKVIKYKLTIRVLLHAVSGAPCVIHCCHNIFQILNECVYFHDTFLSSPNPERLPQTLLGSEGETWHLSELSFGGPTSVFT